MINIDSRLVQEVPAPGPFRLLCYLGSMMNEQRLCYPGNKKMCRDLDISLPTLQSWKKFLTDNGLIEVRTRLKENSPGQTSNYYLIKTPLVSNYTPTKKLSMGDVKEVDTPPIKDFDMGDVKEVDTPPIKDFDMGDVKEVDTTPAKEVGNEVLITEVLTNEVLVNESLKKEKRILFHYQSSIFDSIIENLYAEYAKLDNFEMFKYAYSPDLQEQIKESRHFKPLDSTTRSLLNKAWEAAEKIHEAIKTLNRPKFKTVACGCESKIHGEGPKVYRFEEGANISKEANLSIKAYCDFCRLSGQFRTNCLSRLPETITSVDWCFRLFEYVKPLIEKEIYDPAFDENLLSDWLVEMYYSSGGWYTRSCLRFSNRVVDGTDEFLLNKNQDRYNENGKRIE